jgi:hypothetical protein
MKLGKIFKKLIIESEINDITWYHGTTKEFTKFDINFFGETDSGWWGYGIYFHTDKDRGGYGNIIKTVKLNFNNPIILPTSYSGRFLYNLIGNEAGLSGNFVDESAMNIIKEIGNKRFTSLALNMGYDGMVIQYSQGTKEAVVFDDSIINIIA